MCVLAVLVILYRVIRRMNPSLSDFWSDYAHGDEPIFNQLVEPLQWAGISTFSDEAEAIKFGRNFVLGRAVVALDIPDNADVIVKQTGRSTYHYSVMGTPHTLKSFVRGKATPITATP